MLPSLNITTENIAELGETLIGAHAWAPQFVNANMEGLGRRVAFLLKLQVRRHKITGKFEESIKHFYDEYRLRLEVGPTRKYGSRGWDAGLILQRGTRPIPNLPFAPIARWAAFRGLPAGPVWWKIKTRGVSAHPFLYETLARGDVQTAISSTARRIGMDFAGAVVQAIPAKGGKMRVLTTSQMTFPGAKI